MDTTACKAKTAFTQFVSGYGQVHGDPDSSDKKAQTVNVPDDLVVAWAENGWITAPKGFEPPENVEALVAEELAKAVPADGQAAAGASAP